jgi:hypothetical protein
MKRNDTVRGFRRYTFTDEHGELPESMPSQLPT